MQKSPIRHRHIAAAVRVGRPLAFAALNGRFQAQLHRGELVRTSTYLLALGIVLKDGQVAWYGKHVAKAYRANRHAEPLRLWHQHSNGRWFRVFVYAPGDPALITALGSYKATAQALADRASFTEAA